MLRSSAKPSARSFARLVYEAAHEGSAVGMPTEIVVTKYLCDYCSRTFDAEYQCHIHETRDHSAQDIYDAAERAKALRQVRAFHLYRVYALALGFAVRARSEACRATIFSLDSLAL